MLPEVFWGELINHSPVSNRGIHEIYFALVIGLTHLAPLRRSRSTVLPFYEYVETGYLVMSDDDSYGVAAEMKQTVAQTLPTNTTHVVYTTSSSKSYQQQLVDQYSQWVASDRLIVLQVSASGSNDFWTRDNLPLPVWRDGVFALVDLCSRL